MGLYIADGKGRGNTAGVSKDNQLMTLATVKTLEHYVNVEFGDSYSSILTITPSVSGACVFYAKNNNDLDLIVEQIEVFSDSDQIITIHLNSEGTPAGGTDTVPANNNSKSAKLADGIFQYGANITGLTNGRIVSRLKIKGGEQSRAWNFPQDLVLGKNRTLTIFCETGSVETNLNIAMYYDHDGANS